MIRLANKNDIQDIIFIWNEAFGDSEEEIRFFLDNRFEEKNTVVFEADGKIVSVLFLLEGNFVIQDISYPSYYLYAACTAIDYRGRGIMANMLEKTKLIASERGKYFICLMPGEESLFDFYGKYGYKPVFSRKILKIKASDINRASLSNKNICLDSFETIRNNAFKNFNRFEWNNGSIEFACKHHLLYGGKIFEDCKGYFLYSETEHQAVVKEFAFAPVSFANYVSVLFNLSDSDSAVIYLPADYPTAVGEYEVKTCGMAVSVEKECDCLLEKLNNAYLALTLD